MSTTTSGWSRLRWPIKAIIIALPIIGLGYLAIEKGMFKSEPPESFQNIVISDKKETPAEKDSKETTTKKKTTYNKPRKPS